MIISVVSGGFDPLHSGHIQYIKSAKEIGDKLIVALNSDKWLEEKKGKFFLPFFERKIILESLAFVDEVIDFETIINEVALLRNKYLGIMKGLDTKQWQIGHITRLRTAGMEDIVIE